MVGKKVRGASESESRVPVRADERKRSLRPGKTKVRKGERDGSRGRRKPNKSCKCEVQVEQEESEARTEAGRDERPDGKSGSRKERVGWKERC